MSKVNHKHLPAGWAIAKIEDLILPDGVFIDGDWVESKDQDPNGDVRLIQLADIGDGIYQNRSSRFLTFEKAQELGCTFLKAGDVLIARMPDPLGRACIFPGDAKEAVTVVDVCIIRTGLGIENHRWLMGAINSPDFRKLIASLQSGVTRSRISRKNLATLSLPVPPLAEQQRIVAEVETQFSRLDAGVENLKRVQANLKHYRSAMLQAACEGQLVPTEAAFAQAEGRDYEPADQSLARILRERRAKWEADQHAKMKEQGKTPKDDKWRNKYKAPAAPNTSKLPELPQGWSWATVEQLAAFDAHSITDGPFGSNLKTEHYTSSGPRVIRLQNIGDGVFNDVHAHISHEHFEKLEKHRVNAGDIVIAVLGEKLPRACIIPSFVGEAIVKADCVRFKPNGDVAVAQYLNFALNAEPTRSRTSAIVHGVGRPRLTLGELKSIALPLPPYSEQQRIVAEVESRLSVLGDMEKAVDANLKRSVGLRQKILKEAFEGRLVPQDTTEESASVLLERIKLEREKLEAEKRSSRKKGVKKVEKKRSTPTVRRDLIEVLREAQEAITPEQLFKSAGYRADEVEEFYAELKKADRAQAFTQKVLDNGDVYLTARS